MIMITYSNIEYNIINNDTHQYPECSLPERKRIEPIELLSTIKDDPLTSGIPENHVKESGKILTGNFD